MCVLGGGNGLVVALGGEEWVGAQVEPEELRCVASGRLDEIEDTAIGEHVVREVELLGREAAGERPREPSSCELARPRPEGCCPRPRGA